MNKKIIIASLLVIIALLGLSVLGKGNQSKKTILSTNQSANNLATPIPTQTISTTLPSGAEKIEVLHFHATQQCMSCINIGKFTKATVEEKFPEEFKSGKITFREINIDLPENQKIAQDYKVSGSALYINAIKNGQDNKEEDTTVWRLVTNGAQLKSYFEAKLKALL